MLSVSVVAAAVTAASLALAPARAAEAAGGISDAEAVGHLNAQRRANGIPGDLAVDQALSDGCNKHNRYMSLNGGMQH